MQFYNAKENLVDHLCAQIFKCQPLLPAEFVDCLFTGIHGCYNKRRNDALGNRAVSRERLRNTQESVFGNKFARTHTSANLELSVRFQTPCTD